MQDVLQKIFTPSSIYYQDEVNIMSKYDNKSIFRRLASSCAIFFVLKMHFLVKTGWLFCNA